MAFISNSRWQNRGLRPNQSTDNGDMGETANRYVFCEGVSYTIVREKLGF